MKLILVLTFILSSCSAPFGKSTSPLSFVEKKAKEVQDQAEIQRKIDALKKDREEKLRLFELEKKETLLAITKEAKNSFEAVRPLFDQKCMNCHNADYKLPLYGRVFGKINPVKKHQIDGLKSLEYSAGYPFKAQGNPPQVALLKSIRNSFIERTMPLKSFTNVYPKKKVNQEDEQLILNWVDPLIDKLEKYEVKYNTVDTSIPGKAQKILEMSCFRCHANGNNRGGYGGMEDTAALLKSKYVDLNSIDQSELLVSMVTGEMPPSKLETLSSDEINVVRAWLEIEAKKNGVLK